MNSNDRINRSNNKINLNAIRNHDMGKTYPSFIPAQSRTSAKKRPTPRTISGSPKKSTSKKFTASTKNNIHLSKNFKKGLVAVIAAASLAVGGAAVGYNYATETTGNAEYSLNEYNASNMFTSTDDLIKHVASDTYFNVHPDEIIRFEDYTLQDYNEISVSSSGDVKLMLNYVHFDSSIKGGVDSRSVPVSLPEDFGKDVYLNYKKMRETSQSFSDDEKGKVSYMIAMNKCVINLRDGLTDYINNAQSKDFKEAAQGALDGSKVITADSSRTDDGDER